MGLNYLINKQYKQSITPSADETVDKMDMFMQC